MPTKAGVGYSSHRHFKAAAAQAVKQAFSEAGADKADLVMAFGAIAYPQEQLVAAIRELTGDATLVGCSANGVIAGTKAVEETFYLGVMVIQSDELRFEAAASSGLSTDPENVGREIGAALSGAVATDTRCLITLVDCVTLNFDRYERGMRTGLGTDRPIPLFGGAAGDDWKMQKTYQYFNGQVLSDSAVAFTLSGDAALAFAVNHGCVVIGEKRVVTKAEGNVIKEIDGQPAYDVLRQYLNEDEQKDWGKTSVNITLGFKPDGDDSELFIRFMPMKDDETGAITISSEVKDGASVWMTRRDQDMICKGVDSIADQVSAQLGGKQPKFVLHFDCGGRGRVIFRDQEKQDLLHGLQEKVSTSAPWMGFYTYGEIGPLNERNCFHTYTLVLLAVA
jgi:hypothetical protein